MRRSSYALASVMAGSLLLYAFWPSAVDVDVVSVNSGPLEVTINEDGRTRVRERYIVSMPMSGQLLRVLLHPGDRVVAGETHLAVIEAGDPALLDARTRAETEARVKAAEARKMHAQAQLERARANVDFATKQQARAEKLRTEKALPEANYDTAILDLRTALDDVKAAEFSVKIAEFELEQSQVALSRTQLTGDSTLTRMEIRAPIDGEVLQVFQESGGLLPAGTNIVELGDRRDMEVEVDVLSSDAVKIAPGATMYLDHWGESGPLLARVRLVEPKAFLKVSALGVEEQRVNVIADFVDPLEVRQRLGDAYRVEARIVTWSTDKTIKCQAGAFFRFHGGWATYRLVHGRARLTPVELGHSSGREVEILSGLQVDDELIAYPGDQIVDGIRVHRRTVSR